METFDVIIIGAGPSGSSCAAFLSKAGRKVLLLDRATFPREKVCGDGISGHSVEVLGKLGILDQVKNVEHQDMYGVTFSSPDGTVVPISAHSRNSKPETQDSLPAQAPGFVCRREVFDNVVFQNAKKLATKTIEGFLATDIVIENEFVVGVKGKITTDPNGNGKEFEFRAKVVVGADGVGGICARKLGAINSNDNHQYAGMRAYYEGVEGMEDKIELHFTDELLMGYFWIFPLPNKRANVGLHMLVRDTKKKKANLQKIFNETIEKHPLFASRFRNAKRITQPKSWLLPLGSEKLKRSGNGYVLVGDAASLIDPFTGEGIGNALTSGMIAAEVINQALAQNDVSSHAFAEYEKRLFEKIGAGIRSNDKLEQMGSHRFMMNYVIGRAKKSKYVQGVISNALINAGAHDQISDPLFLLKAMFAP